MDMILDIHTHTIASGHGSMDTINQLAQAASKKGLSLLGISEHTPAIPGACTVSYFNSLILANRKRFHIDLLFGAEVNILDCNGLLDLPDKTLKSLDYNIASLHPQCIAPSTIKNNTNAYINAMKHPNIHIIGHPDDEKYPIECETFVLASKKYHTLIELNNSSLSPNGYRGNAIERDRIILSLCKEHHVPIIAGSDSHGCKNVGNFTYANALLEEMNFPKELIVNYNKKMLMHYISP